MKIGIKDRLLKLKIYIGRATTYLTIINSGMLLFLFLSTLKDKGAISMDLDKYFILIFAVGLATLIVVGWIDINLFKGLQSEIRLAFEYNPPFKDIKDKVTYLFEKEKLREAEKDNGST